MRSFDMRRRQYLSAVAGSSLAATAGCTIGSNDAGGEEKSANGRDADGNETDDVGDGSDDEDGNETDGGEGESENEDGGDEDGRDEQARLESIRADVERYDPDRERFPGARLEVTDEFSLVDGLTVVTFAHGAGSSFVLELLDGEGDPIDVIADYEGAIEGAAAIPTAAGEYALDVASVHGYWEIEVAQPVSPNGDVRRPPAVASGTGPDVVGPVAIDGPVTIDARHEGSSTFTLTLYDETASDAAGSEVVFDATGTFEDETTIEFDAVTWIGVEADGDWSFELADEGVESPATAESSADVELPATAAR